MSTEILYVILGHAIVFSIAMAVVNAVNARGARRISKIWDADEFDYDPIMKTRIRLMSEMWDVDHYRYYVAIPVWTAATCMLISLFFAVHQIETKAEKNKPVEKAEAVVRP